MGEQVPSVGRVVHYVATNGACIPADVCAVHADGLVTLFVKDSTTERTYFAYRIPMDSTAAMIGCWHWPERVPAKDV